MKYKKNSNASMIPAVTKLANKLNIKADFIHTSNCQYTYSFNNKVHYDETSTHGFFGYEHGIPFIMTINGKDLNFLIENMSDKKFTAYRNGKFNVIKLKDIYNCDSINTYY